MSDTEQKWIPNPDYEKATHFFEIYPAKGAFVEFKEVPGFAPQSAFEVLPDGTFRYIGNINMPVAEE